MKVWRDRLSDRNDRLRSYLTFYQQTDLLPLFPMAAFGMAPNFGQSLDALDIGSVLLQEREVIEKE